MLQRALPAQGPQTIERDFVGRVFAGGGADFLGVRFDSPFQSGKRVPFCADGWSLSGFIQVRWRLSRMRSLPQSSERS